MSDPGSTWELVYGHPVASDFAAEMFYANGRWLAVVDEFTDAPVIVTASGDGSDWTVVTLPASATRDVPLAAAYGDGTWLLIARDNCWTASNPTGTWTRHNRTLLNGSVPFLAGYDGTYWVEACGNKIYTATSPTGTRTERATLEEGIDDLRYLEGVWVASALKKTPSFAGKVYSASDPTGTWTLQATVGTTSGDIFYWPDGWVLVTGDTIYKSPALTGTWSSVAFDSYWAPVAYADGDYVAQNDRYLRTATALAGPYVDVELDRTPYTLRGIAPGNREWLAAGRYVVGPGSGAQDQRFGIWRATDAADGWGVILS